MASPGGHGPSDDKPPTAEHNLGPTPASGLPGIVTQPLESVASEESEGTPSVDDGIPTDEDVRRLLSF
jgi:hypothetical protein